MTSAAIPCVADDPGWPAFAAYHNEDARALSAAASAVGGGRLIADPPALPHTGASGTA